MNKATAVVIAVVLIGFGYWATSSLFFGEKTPSASLNGAEEENTKNGNEGGVVCIQVITPARNPATGEIREFPTPCDVPEGWEKVENDIPGLNIDVESDNAF